MGKQDEGKSVTRRDVLKLAGTAAAFCTSFGFLHGSQTGGAVQGKTLKMAANKELQLKWQQAEFKWYSGNELLGTSPFPAKVLKHLQSDEMATVEFKFFRGGNLLRNMGTIEAKH
jgi:hypothetical protein